MVGHPVEPLAPRREGRIFLNGQAVRVEVGRDAAVVEVVPVAVVARMQPAPVGEGRQRDQAAGGAGQKGIDELAAQVPIVGANVEDLVHDGAKAAGTVTPSTFVKTLAYNVVPLLGDLDPNGYTDEELKLLYESRKILGLPELTVTPLCVRVPVMVGHAIAIKATFQQDVDLAEALEALSAFPNLTVQTAPTPLEAAGLDETFVGRVRLDLSNPKALNFFVVGDNLLKGAALNTVQLAELAVSRGVVTA